MSFAVVWNNSLVRCRGLTSSIYCQSLTDYLQTSTHGKEGKGFSQDNKRWCDERVQRVEKAIELGTVNDSFHARVLQDKKGISFYNLSEVAYITTRILISNGVRLPLRARIHLNA
jgi:hypothetical protein